jgi:septal ring factor EnvC (AmiA/AmiB activator)
MEGTDSSLVTFRGTVIDVEKLQEKLDKSEKVRAATDSKLIELQKKFSSVKESNERGEKSREKLSGELKDVKKKARGLEDDLSAQTKEAAKYLTALGDVFSKVMPIVKPPKATEVKGTETLPQVNGVNKGADDDEMEKEETTEQAAK